MKASDVRMETKRPYDSSVMKIICLNILELHDLTITTEVIQNLKVVLFLNDMLAKLF